MASQPKGFTCFFLTEMWERYGFYVIQTILILYLIERFQLTDEFSYSVLGSITALSYANAVLGGIVADRWLGQRVAVFLGAALLSIGYSMVAIANQLPIVFFAFAIITLGTGLFKPSICNLFGQLYAAGDVRRHSGFTYFYVGVNLGIILGETLASVIQRYWGWHSVFFSAAMVLVMSLVFFYVGSRRFVFADDQRLTTHPRHALMACVTLLIALGVDTYIVTHSEQATLFFAAAAIACVILILYYAYRYPRSRRSLGVFLCLLIISTVYWSMYFQMFFSMNLFIERVVNRHCLGMTLVPAIYPSIEALGVIVLGPVLAWLWMYLTKVKPQFNPSIPMKFTLALAIHTLALGLFYVNALITDAQHWVAPIGLITPYLLIALSELLVMPVGLAMVGELLPPQLTSVMVGIFFISLGLGGKLAGILANMASIPSGALDDRSQMASIYQHAFLKYFVGALLVTVLCYIATSALKKAYTPSQISS